MQGESKVDDTVMFVVEIDTGIRADLIHEPQTYRGILLQAKTVGISNFSLDDNCLVYDLQCMDIFPE